MSNFLQQKKIDSSCKCSARKNAIYQDTYNYPIINKPGVPIDILILLEFKEIPGRFDYFKQYCQLKFKDYSYVILPALGCTPEGFSLKSDTVSIYTQCKQTHIKKMIIKYAPKIIITTGRALYTITESKDLKPDHFYVPVNEGLEKYQEDDTWMYSSEFNCKIFPIPPMYHFVKNNKFKDVYEKEFVFAQFNRVIEHLKLRKERVIIPQFHFESNPNKLIQLYIDRNDQFALAIDTESSGLNYFTDTLYSIQFSDSGVSGVFCVFQDVNRELLIQLFNKKNITFIMHNAQHDLKFLKQSGIHNARCDFDTMLASHLLNENSPNGLKPLTWLYTTYGGYENSLKKYLKDYKLNDYTQLPQEILVKYSCYDVIITWQLYNYFISRFEKEDPCISHNFYNYIMPTVEMITDVEMTGVQIDFNYLNEYVETIKNKIIDIEEIIYKIANKKFNIKSGKELTKVLLNIPEFRVLTDNEGKELRTKTGDLILDKETIVRYAKELDLDFMKKISEYYHLTKELSQLGFSIEKKESIKNKLFNIESNEEESKEIGFLASIYNGRLHGGYKLYGTETGRMSGGGGLASTINWQNMPKTKEFRKMFLSLIDFVMGYSDYDAMEVAILSQLAGKGPLEQIILDKKDMHCYTCVNLAKLKGISTTYEEIFAKTKIEGQEDKEFIKMRTDSKVLNFQASYGATKFGIAQTFGVSPEEGEKFLEVYYTSFPEVERYIKLYRDHAKRYGYVKTLLGRKRRLPELTYIGEDSYYNKDSFFSLNNSLNAAINAPDQGTSGQTTLIAMTKIWKEFKEKNMKSKIIINVHDEIVLDLCVSEIEDAEKIIKHWMEYPYYENNEGNTVRLSAGLSYGEIWKYGYSTKYWNEHKEDFEKVKNTINQRNLQNIKKII